MKKLSQLVETLAYRVGYDERAAWPDAANARLLGVARWLGRMECAARAESIKRMLTR